jgi:hypothetical protein
VTEGGSRDRVHVTREGARIPGASHYVLADNPQAVADLIERAAAGDAT